MNTAIGMLQQAQDKVSEARIAVEAAKARTMQQIQAAKSLATSAKARANQMNVMKYEDDLLAMSRAPINFMTFDEIINPSTGEYYTQAEAEEAIANAIHRETQNAEDQLVQLALDPHGLGSYSDVINPSTGQPYTFQEGQLIVDRKLGQDSGVFNLILTEKLDVAFPLGSLSEVYETSGLGPGTIANNSGDIGGASYGTYQLATSQGSPQNFLNSSFAAVYAPEFAGLTPGTPAFDAKWIEVADRDPDGFGAAQHDFIAETYYDASAAKIQESLNFDISDRSRALHNVVWSVAVQHGQSITPIIRALDGLDLNNLSDEEIINRIYAERSKRNSSGELAYFYGNSLEIQAGVANRFVNEEIDAIEALAEEKVIAATV